MPQYLQLIRIDWHFDTAPKSLQVAIIDGNAILESSYHTLDTFRAALEEIAQKHGEIVAEALVDDGYRAHVLFQVANGKVREHWIEERPEGALRTKLELPYDHVATVTVSHDRDAIADLIRTHTDYTLYGDDSTFDLPLHYASEAGLRAVAERVATVMVGEPGHYVGEVEGVRYYVELAPGRASVRRLLPLEHRELVERLVAGNYTHVPAPATERDPDSKYEAALYWPEDMLETIQQEAVRTDRSLSFIVQYAWTTVGPQIARIERQDLSPAIRAYTGTKRKQTMFFPGRQLDEIEAQAQRLDSSQSFVAQCAVALARDAVAALPTVSEFPGDDS